MLYEVLFSINQALFSIVQTVKKFISQLFVENLFVNIFSLLVQWKIEN